MLASLIAVFPPNIKLLRLEALRQEQEDTEDEVEAIVKATPHGQDIRTGENGQELKQRFRHFNLFLCSLRLPLIATLVAGPPGDKRLP